MGLSSHLHDVSGAAPLPLLLLASLASELASLFYGPTAAGCGPTLPSGLAALADHLAASSVSTAAAAGGGDCTVCLSAMAEGDRVRTLACRHAFHAACLDGWFDQTSLSCPLCRAGPPAHAGDDAVSWFSGF